MFLAALPYMLSFLFLPIVAAAATWGGWLLALIPLWGFVLSTAFDAVLGLDQTNRDPATGDAALAWHRAITLVWPIAQTAMIYGALAAAIHNPALAGWEAVALMAGVGLASGGIGITFAHEMMHQKNRLERAAAEFLMTQTLYGHFVTEHVLGHHRAVCTPEDPATARYGESFWAFLPRVLSGSLASAWAIEADRRRRRGRPVLGPGNPFWRYVIGALAFLALAFAVGGWAGVGLYLMQAAVAIVQLEAVNYVEHYGLTRQRRPDGRYEHVRPHHSWNAAHKWTNWLLINLQRHSDHHWKPDRRFPLLQTYPEAEAPQLPFGYPLMIAAALTPPLWRRLMHPRVTAWRARFQPETPA
jgi:alkane 1-monooxygenase